MDKWRTIRVPMQTLEEMVTRIVEHFHAQRLILFGSHARGEAQEDSDFDLLIMAPRVSRDGIALYQSTVCWPVWVFAKAWYGGRQKRLPSGAM